MSQLNLPLEQPKKVLELKLEISNMQDDLKAYENLHKKLVENFMYSIHKKRDELRNLCIHNNTIENELWDYHNNIGYSHITCIDCGKIVKSI